MSKYRNPIPTVDIAIFNDKMEIILIKRKNPPHGWALPGGFVDYGENLYKAALREAKEETNLDVDIYEQFFIYSDPNRDPRQHTISTVFLAKTSDTPIGGDDALEARFFNKNNLPENVVFDHRLIIDDIFTYLETGKKNIPLTR